MMTSRRPTRRRLRRSNVAAAAILAGSLSVAHAADSAVDWQFTPGTGKRVDVPSCHDQQGLVLSAPNASSTGAVNAKIQFQGSSITLYGTRYDNGAPALIVVDGNYSSAIHADESLTATDGESPNSCIILASFTNLGVNTRGHTVEIILPGDAVAPMTFTIANVTTSETLSNPGIPNPGSGTSPAESHSSNAPAHGPNIAAIVGPIVAVVLLIAGGVVLWLLRRRRIRNAKKAPSAAFRAQHPALPMGNIHNPNAGGQTEDDISPRHRSLSPSHALSLAGSSHIHSAGSSGTTLVADLDDEKKKLADILAVRDAHRLEIQAQLMSASARDAGERVPWDTRGGAGAGYGGWDAPGRGSGRGVPVAGWDPGDGERDARY